MKFVFFGTPEFAAIILETITKAGFKPLALISNPDKPVGRKHLITPPPSKIIAEEFNIPVLQPTKITPDFLETLKNLQADFFVVAAYAKILPQELIDIPRLGVIGVHPSLLPKLRGTTPIQTAILNQETETGVSLYLIDSQMDHGPILTQEKLTIEPNDNTESLTKKLAELSAEMLIKTFPDFSAEKIRPKIQDESEATFTNKVETKDAFIDSNELESSQENNSVLAKKLDAKIRAFYPEPGAWTIKNGKRLKLLNSEIKDGLLKLKQIQWEGKRIENL